MALSWEQELSIVERAVDKALLFHQDIITDLLFHGEEEYTHHVNIYKAILSLSPHKKSLGGFCLSKVLRETKPRLLEVESYYEVPGPIKVCDKCLFIFL